MLSPDRAGVVAESECKPRTTTTKERAAGIAGHCPDGRAPRHYGSLRPTTPTFAGKYRALRILITDGEQRASLAAVRSLGRAGHHVFVCSVERKPLAGASRFCRGSFQVPDPNIDGDGFRGAVERLVDGEDIALLLPMTDVSAPLLLDFRSLRPDVVVPFPERDAYERLTDKVGLSDLASELGVPVPDRLVLETKPTKSDLTSPGAPLSRFLERIGFPLILKPGRSVVPADGGPSRFGVAEADCRERLEELLLGFHPAAFPLMVQQRITGPGLGAFLLTDQGRVLASFGHRRLREKPPTGGVSVYREGVRPRPDVLEHASRLLARVGWSGVAMVEFKEDRSTGTPYLMEVNGRFWGSLQLAIDSGVDFPKLLVDCATGETLPTVPAPRPGIRSRWFWGDVDHLIGILTAHPGYRDAHPELPSKLRALGRFAIPWRPGDRFEVLRLGDPAPFLLETGRWFRGL